MSYILNNEEMYIIHPFIVPNNMQYSIFNNLNTQMKHNKYQTLLYHLNLAVLAIL